MDVLRRNLESLQSQSLSKESFEVIIVDDGSTDDTVAFLKELTTPLNLKVLHQENAGPAAARNRGINAASGPVLVFINDDTVLSNEALQMHHAKQFREGNQSKAI